MQLQLLPILCHLGIMLPITYSRCCVKQSSLAGMHEGVIKLLLSDRIQLASRYPVRTDTINITDSLHVPAVTRNYHLSSSCQAGDV